MLTRSWGLMSRSFYCWICYLFMLACNIPLRLHALPMSFTVTRNVVYFNENLNNLFLISLMEFPLWKWYTMRLGIWNVDNDTMWLCCSVRESAFFCTVWPSMVTRIKDQKILLICRKTYLSRRRIIDKKLINLVRIFQQSQFLILKKPK